MVEQLTLNQWVQGSSPWRCTIYSSIAQSVERMTVNHDVTGSSPVRGAKTKDRTLCAVFLFCLPWLCLCNGHQLNSHCLLRKRLLIWRSGCASLRTFRFLSMGKYLSSPAKIPRTRYARVTWFSPVREAKHRICGAYCFTQ